MFAPASGLTYVGESIPQPWPIEVPSDWPSGESDGLTQYEEGGFGFTTATFTTDRHRHMLVSYVEFPSEYHWHDAVLVKAGWPMPLFGGWERLEYHAQLTPSATGREWASNKYRDYSGIPLPTTLPRGLRYERPLLGRRYYLPITPIWSGVAINWLFCSLLTAMPLLTPWLIRLAIAARRRRADLCIRCKYDLTGLDLCPECGTSVEPLIPLRMRPSAKPRNEP